MNQPIALRELPLALKSEGRSLQIAICEALRSSMQDGRLRPGARLPSSRDLARQLRVARGTVVLAYEQLAAEGYLRGARGAGTMVVESLPERWFMPSRSRPPTTKAARSIVLSKRGEHLARSPFPIARLPAPRPFRPHAPAVDAFPGALWGRLLARHARNARPDRLREADARGYRPLREAIAEHLRVYRGVLCSADQVVIGGGTQQILDLLARLLLDEGDVVWVEDPGHFGARDVLQGAGARLVPVPVDRAGIDVRAGIAAAPDARMAYVTPARQSPLGATLSLERRVRLLEWARRSDAWVFEDDYDSEFRYDGRPLPALQGLDRHGVVIYTGTFTKKMFPGIRLACAVLPDALVDPFGSALSLLLRHVPLLPQLALCDFISDFKNYSDPVGALNEIHRALKPAGTASIYDLRKDASRHDIEEEVKGMKSSPLNAALTKWIFRTWLLRTAYRRDALERMAAQSHFGGCEIVEDGVGLEMRLSQIKPFPGQ